MALAPALAPALYLCLGASADPRMGIGRRGCFRWIFSEGVLLIRVCLISAKSKAGKFTVYCLAAVASALAFQAVMAALDPQHPPKQSRGPRPLSKV